jgi:hypothetical protein
MTREEATRLLAQAVPARMKRLRGRLMLDELTDALGTADAVCPACSGTGWLDAGLMEDCPVCLGFREVPASLADWFRDRLKAMLNGRRALSVGDGAPVPGRTRTALRRDGRRLLHPLKCHVSLRD